LVNDISTNDSSHDFYQTRRVSRVNVWRLLESGSTCPSWGCGSGVNTGYTRLRAYQFNQNQDIYLSDGRSPTGTPTPQYYHHLTLNSITPLGADNSTQLPNTSFVYYTGSESFGDPKDQGHLYQARNGYGGEVRYYYDAAGGDLKDNTN